MKLAVFLLLIGLLQPAQLLADEKDPYIDEVLHLYKAEDKWTNFVTTFVRQKKGALADPERYESVLDAWLKDELSWGSNEPKIRAQLRRGYTVEQLSAMANSLKAKDTQNAKRSASLTALLSIGNSTFQAAIRPLLDQLMMMEAEYESSIPPVTTIRTDGSVTTQIGDYSSVTEGEKFVTFDFSSPPLPVIDLVEICAGDITRFEPLFNLLQPYVGYFQNYTFAEGSEGPLCKEEIYSAPNGGRLYRIVLSQYVGPYELRDIRVSVARTKSEVRTLSFSGSLFLSEITEHQPDNWIPVEEAHQLAIEALLTVTPIDDHARYRRLPIPVPQRYAMSGIDDTDGLSFTPIYELWVDSVFVYVNRLTGEAVADIPKAVY
ncbi:MAG: hypothetical protein CME43_01620 [Haliea sp.]|uniref:hypothetical protein n=1 Tax=Haliea sp. TaxID=1932666 RepID=UPI000C5A1F11|nr:hypothetical protein [Haliea sp.]MBM68070.1 hypothetical protein [Haliea sp.]MBM68160.1 hypothetical protein [Haliea sp.]